jgi:hypothetical protein
MSKVKNIDTFQIKTVPVTLVDGDQKSAVWTALRRAGAQVGIPFNRLGWTKNRAGDESLVFIDGKNRSSRVVAEPVSLYGIVLPDGSADMRDVRAACILSRTAQDLLEERVPSQRARGFITDLMTDSSYHRGDAGEVNDLKVYTITQGPYAGGNLITYSLFTVQANETGANTHFVSKIVHGDKVEGLNLNAQAFNPQLRA